MSKHTVTAPLIITKKADGSDLYLYEGAVLPDSVSAEEIKRLQTLGLVDKPEEGEKTAPKKPISESN